MLSEKYEIEVYSLDPTTATLTRLDVITTFKDLSFFNALNGIGACRFSLASQDPKATGSNLIRYKNQLVIRRNGDIVWLGPITRITEDYMDVTGNIVVEANTYLMHLKTRFTDKLVNYVQQEQADIAWDLINTVQTRTNGNLAISAGSLPSSVLRDRTYEYGTVSELLVNLTNVIDGFDFTFDAVESGSLLTGVTFNCYYPEVGSYRDDLQVLRIGDNIKRYQKRTDGDLINSGIAEGAGSGTPIQTTLDYSASQQAYTRREVILTRKDISEPNTLAEVLDKELTQYSVENWLIDVVLYQDRQPLWTEFVIGDYIRLDITIPNGSGYGDFEGRARIVELAVDVDAQGAETITPKLEVQI
jgi:hypothetical protein